jgi:hypothetical protein
MQGQVGPQVELRVHAVRFQQSTDLCDVHSGGKNRP